MSSVTLRPIAGRAGRLVCICEGESLAPDAAAPSHPALGRTAAGFAFAVLAQTLAVAVLPSAGATLAPHGMPGSLPYALMLVGGAVATMPAAVLVDRFGRRSAFALGAGVGLAGSILGAWSIAVGQFGGLALAAFWLGIAQGFGLFYRHAAALHARNRRRAIAVVLGSGVSAALLAPLALIAAQSNAGPLAPAVALIVAGAAQLAALALSTTLPGPSLGLAMPPPRSLNWHAYAATTLAGAAAWFGMSMLMAASPSMMAMCGIGAATASSLIALHILSMYAPAAILGSLARDLRAVRPTAAGLALLALAILAATKVSTMSGFALVLPLGGAGWSLAMLGTTLLIHANGTPARGLLAVHDASLFTGAVVGALAASGFY